MTKTITFNHTFPKSDAPLTKAPKSEGSEIIQIRNIPDQGIWISANKEGWKKLAQICAELALGSSESGYHFHVTKDFKLDEENNEVAFEVL